MATSIFPASQQKAQLQSSEPLAHSSQVNRVVFSPTNDLLVTAEIDGNVRGWTTDFRTPQFSMNHSDLVWFIQFRPDGQVIATTSLDETAQVWNADNGTAIGNRLRHADKLTECCFSSDGNFLATGGLDNLIKVWTWEGSTARLVDTLPVSGWPTSIHFDRGGGNLLTSDNSGNAIMWSNQSNQFLPKYQFSVPKFQLLHAEFHPGEEFVVACGGIDRVKDSFQLGNGVTYLFDPVTANLLAPPLYHFSEVKHSFFDAAGEHLISSSNDHYAVIWNLTTDKRSAEEIKRQAELLSGWSIDANGQLVAIAAEELKKNFAHEVRPVKEAAKLNPQWTKYVARVRNAGRSTNPPVDAGPQ